MQEECGPLIYYMRSDTVVARESRSEKTRVRGVEGGGGLIKADDDSAAVRTIQTSRSERTDMKEGLGRY